MFYSENEELTLNSEETPTSEEEQLESVETENSEQSTDSSLEAEDELPVEPEAVEKPDLTDSDAEATESTPEDSDAVQDDLEEVEGDEPAVMEADTTSEITAEEQAGSEQAPAEIETQEVEEELASEEAEQEDMVSAPDIPTTTIVVDPSDSEVDPSETVFEPEEEVQTEPSEFDEEGRSWFVVHCYSGYENKVRHNLEQRIETMGMKDKIFDIVVPTEEEIEVKEGKRRTVERRVFPGYILVNMVMTEESWYVVRNTPGVTGFVGMGNTPTPLRPEEVSQIIKRMEAEAPRIKVTFKSGERVRIVDGPFNDFRGTVAEIDMERAKVRVMVNFFGRETPVELDFLQVEKT